MGIEPELGAQFTLTFDVDGHETTQTFTLCGWWERDGAVQASHMLIPESRVDAILDEVGADPNNPTDGMTGTWNLDVMLKSGSRQIEQDLNQILASHGYQSETPGENYIDTGINWGYTGAQLSDSMDPATAAVIAGMLLLILLTGYLIIYNVFQISVAGDIRFYGLLKTIGTTGRQLKRIIRYQALALSALGIPLGLLTGWLIGGQLTPVIISHLDGVSGVVSVSPALFLGSALFALFTVLLSCHRPGRMAAKVSPIEAVRYTERAGRKSRRPSGKRLAHKGAGRSSLPAMAWANLGRSRGKTAVTITSLSLAVVLLTVTVNFTNGFDMDKYVSNFTASDFIVANAGKFQNSVLDFTPDMAVPQSAMDDIGAQEGITDGGVVYGQTSSALEYITEDYFRQMNQRFYTPEQLDSAIRLTGRNEAGDLAANVQLSGMSPFALDHLTVLEGDLSKLYEDGGKYVAAVYAEDDYGKADMDSHWARLGDTVTIRYVEEWEYVDPDTGIDYSDAEDVPAGSNWVAQPTKYRDAAYQVAALVTVPSAYYAFDTTGEANASMEEFLKNYTENVNPELDYESKALYAGEFESMRSMFLLLGGALSFIVGLVGVLNFFNAILTGILARKRELAVLQSIGMTGKQLKTMLVYEGLFYALGAAAISLALTLILGPAAFTAVGNLFWFFTYRLTLVPFLVVIPIFALLGILVPLGVYRSVARHTIVERLREAET